MKFDFSKIKNKKILTVTLNPAIDKQWWLDDLQMGEVNRVLKVNNTAGGKGLNEARVLHQLKLNVTVSGIIAGGNGASLKMLLDNEGIKHNFFEIKNGETRVCVNACIKNQKITEMLEPGPIVSATDANKFLFFFKSIISKYDIVSFAGSLPKGLEPNFYGKLIQICHSKKVTVFLDTSGEALIQNLNTLPVFVKPNVDEIRQLLKQKTFTNQQAITFAKKYVSKGIKNFVVSLGGDGALLVTHNAIYHAVPPKHKVVNTVGCGDTLVAGFIAAELLNVDPSQKILIATALATNASTTEKTAELNLKTLNQDLPKVIKIK
jgi:tagatose 6-phosphate kinase